MGWFHVQILTLQLLMTHSEYEFFYLDNCLLYLCCTYAMLVLRFLRQNEVQDLAPQMAFGWFWCLPSDEKEKIRHCRLSLWDVGLVVALDAVQGQLLYRPNYKNCP